MSVELKPCPFCGGEADYRTIGNCVYIKCINCGCTTQTYHYKEKNDAINAWNRRHSLWHTGESTEEGYYLIAFHPWGRKENGICYSCLEWKDNRWFDRVYDCDTEPYLIAWKKIEEPYKED